MKAKTIAAMTAILACAPLVHTAAQTSYNEIAAAGIDSLEAGNNAAAVALFQKAIEKDPKAAHNVLLFSNLGTALRNMGRDKDAIAAYSSALNFAPLSVPVLLSRATAYLEQGENDKALTDLSIIIDQKPQHETALLLRAYVWNKKGEYEKAEKDYKSLLAITPAHKSGRLGLAVTYDGWGKRKEATEIISALAAEYPDDPDIFMTRANIAFNMGHDDLALADADIVLSIDQEYTDAYLLKGDIYARKGDMQTAELYYRQATDRGYPKELIKRRLETYKTDRKTKNKS